MGCEALSNLKKEWWEIKGNTGRPLGGTSVFPDSFHICPITFAGSEFGSCPIGNIASEIRWVRRYKPCIRLRSKVWLHFKTTNVVPLVRLFHLFSQMLPILPCIWRHDWRILLEHTRLFRIIETWVESAYWSPVIWDGGGGQIPWRVLRTKKYVRLRTDTPHVYPGRLTVQVCPFFMENCRELAEI